jgi:hypothetical protein
VSEPEPEPEDVDFIGAIKLAMVASADLETEHKCIEAILAVAPQPKGTATWPTRILVDAIGEIGGKFTT